jgi:hypothetical protein
MEVYLDSFAACEAKGLEFCHRPPPSRFYPHPNSKAKSLFEIKLFSNLKLKQKCRI